MFLTDSWAGCIHQSEGLTTGASSIAYRWFWKCEWPVWEKNTWLFRDL